MNRFWNPEDRNGRYNREPDYKLDFVGTLIDP